MLSSKCCHTGIYIEHDMYYACEKCKMACDAYTPISLTLDDNDESDNKTVGTQVDHEA
jgi:hypothetical protein